MKRAEFFLRDRLRSSSVVKLKLSTKQDAGQVFVALIADVNSDASYHCAFPT